MKRELKPPRQRIPKDRVTFSKILQDVSRETGYTREDVEHVLKSFLGHIVNYLLQKKLVVLPGIGRIYPYLKRSRECSVLRGKSATGKVTVPSRFVLKMTASHSMVEDLKGVKVTEQDELNILKG